MEEETKEKLPYKDGFDQESLKGIFTVVEMFVSVWFFVYVISRLGDWLSEVVPIKFMVEPLYLILMTISAAVMFGFHRFLFHTVLPRLVKDK